MTDFVKFIEVDVHDCIRDKKPIDGADLKNMKKITKDTKFSRVQLRRYLVKYVPERIMWTGIDPVFNDTRERDTHRYYWSAKMAKDLIILSGKQEFTYQEIEGYFVDRVILNYLNEMIIGAIEKFEALLIKEGNIKEAYFDEHLSHHERVIPFLKKAKRISKFIDMNNIYYQFADIIERNDTKIFKENLADLNDFREESNHYMPILDPREKKITIDNFRTPQNEPHLIFEDKFDNLTHPLDRRVRRSPLSQDMGIADQKLKYQYEQRDINNTHIMRGFHVTVRSANGTVLNDRYGPGPGPFEDSRDSAGEVLWYRPQDNMHPDYVEGEELKKNYRMKRPRKFKIDHFDDKRAVYFQRIKKSIFLPRCLRELQTTHLYLKHDWVRCPMSN